MPVISFGNSSDNLNYPSVKPTLDLNFAATKILDSRISFSRASTGTYTDGQGIIQTAASGVGRFDHNASTGESLGLLVEESRTNLLTYSQNFDSTYYSTGYDGGSFLPNAIVAPDGTITASKLIRNAGTSGCWWGIYGKRFISVTSGVSYTVSCYLKAAEISTVSITGDVREPGGLLQSATFTLTGSGSYTLGAGTSAQITSAGNGWYRCSVTGIADATANEEPALVVFGTGTSGQGFYAWGFQVEAGAFPTSYIPTPASFTSRASTATFYDSAGVVQTAGVDVARSNAFFPDSSGVMRSAGLLLEAAGTNLLTHSENMTGTGWNTSGQNTPSLNVIAAPDGTTTADLLTENTSTGVHQFYKTITVATGNVTYSAFFKAKERSKVVLDRANVGRIFDLTTGTSSTWLSNPVNWSMEKLPNGWYRCSITINEATTTGEWFMYLHNGTTQSYTGDGASGVYIWGAQAEQSSYPTSYIPTVASTVTRSADVSSSSTVTRSVDAVSISGTNFTNFYNQTEGTVFCQGISNSTNNSTYWTLQGSGSNGITALVYPANSLITQAQDNGVLQMSLGFGSYPAVASTKTAVGIKLNDFAAISNGGSIFTDSSVNVPPVTSLVIGNYLGGGTSFDYSGTISRLTYWPIRVSNSQLQLLTQ